ncbi:DUF4350 domain-containing protein [Trueperella sp. LYQ143]|uniref:DUF4350 domain-containing protein n=1 Tax=unclassified Trueperella TaxID=2630174 RepID=UPI0039834069
MSTSSGFAVARTQSSRKTIFFFTFIVLIAFICLLFFRVPHDESAYSIDSSGPDGTMALASILREHGVEVTSVSAEEALASTGEDHTIVLVGYFQTAYVEQLKKYLLNTNAHVVLIDSAIAFDDTSFSGRIIGLDPTNHVPARCDNSDAQAAQYVSGIDATFIPDDPQAVSGCFPIAQGFGAITPRDYPHITLLPSGTFLTNSLLNRDGNAAFALRLLGKHPSLLWVDQPDKTPSEDHSQTLALPDWAVPAFCGALLTFLWLALWRGRRFGPLVAEPIPVIVPARETDHGRARLYARGHNRQHAAQSLRIGTLNRIAQRCGFTPTSDPQTIVNAVVAASGYAPEHVSRILFTDPISTDRDLIILTARLEQLERDIHVY